MRTKLCRFFRGSNALVICLTADMWPAFSCMYGFDKNSWEKRKMKRKKMVVAGTTVIVPLTVAGLADEHGHGYKKHQDPDDDNDRGDHYHREHERGEMRGWHHDLGDNLPPGVRQEGSAAAGSGEAVAGPRNAPARVAQEAVAVPRRTGGPLAPVSSRVRARGHRRARSPREPQLVHGVGYFSLREISVANDRGRTGGSLKPSFRFLFGLRRTRRDAHRQSEAASVLRKIFVHLRPEVRSFQSQHARLSRGSRLRQRASSTPQEPQLSPRHTSGTHSPLPLGRSYATRRSRRAEFFEPKAMQLQIALSMTPSRPACGT